MQILNLRRFASAKQCHHIKSVVGGGERLRHSSPHPLYNNVKNNLRRLLFTQGNQTRNAKFDKTKFSIVNLRVSVRQI